MNAEEWAKREVEDPFSENTEKVARALLLAIEALEFYADGEKLSKYSDQYREHLLVHGRDLYDIAREALARIRGTDAREGK